MSLRIYPGGTCPVGGVSPYSKKNESPAPVDAGQRYDQVEFSFCLDDTQRRVKETVGRLSQEIRCRVTAQNLEALRQQVAEGTYQPNAREIAARMLLLGEE